MSKKNKRKSKNNNVINVPSNNDLNRINNDQFLSDFMKEQMILLHKTNKAIKDQAMKALKYMENNYADLIELDKTPMVLGMEIVIPELEDNSINYVTDVVSQYDSNNGLQAHSGLKFKEAFIVVFHLDIRVKFVYLNVLSTDLTFGNYGNDVWMHCVKL